ncbi:MAG TPA: UDP-N-acetylmuramoyl-L-alanyl-D-glutamate--2,6-diaminopimelate ligase [Acidimicrobiales bacterium]|nr:UDP-N-acetylmuramoyl-L-alanyl-D-glutamate--2,6-diaminopimelate ligase [Acidimicrobiales bacterium]
MARLVCPPADGLTLDVLCRHLGARPPEPAAATTVTGVTHDARRVSPGDLYLGLGGRRFHGASFDGEAARRGAVAMVSDRFSPRLPTIAVTDPRAVAGTISSLVYGHPSRRLPVLGVTGTNGKTTTAYLLDHLLRAAGDRVGRITTVDTVVGEQVEPSTLTTPEAADLQATLAGMVDAGCDSAVVEVSSHGLALGRLEGTQFAVGVFTNLGRDHYDFHGGSEAYFMTKASLFTRGSCAAGVVNVDDPAGRRLAAMGGCATTTVSGEGAPDADWRVTRAEVNGASSRFTVVGPVGEISVDLPLSGAHNVHNAVAALAAAHLRGADVAEIADTLPEFPGVPGRLQLIDAGQPFAAMVDFAHNPDGLRVALRSLRAQVKGRMIVVFGAPGDRDRGKRPLMREVAAAEADVVIVTTDDPYGEVPEAIIGDIMAGADLGRDGVDYYVEADRADAIARAVQLASAGDGLLLAGRGHETVQTFGAVGVPFDDREELRRALLASSDDAGRSPPRS